MRKNAKCRNKNCKKITLTKNSLRDFSSGKPSAEQIFLTVCSVHQKASQSSPPAGGESIEIIFPAACTSEKYRSVRQCAVRPLLADDPCAQRTAISTSEKPAGLFRKKSPRRSGVILEKLLQGLLGGLDESAERSGIRDRELGEALAVHLDACLLYTSDAADET